MNFIKRIVRIVRYVLVASKADDCWRRRNYSEALKYTMKAEKIAPLSPSELIRRAHIYMRLREFSMSIDEAKKAIISIEKRNNYTKYDKDYLIYYASCVGIFSQCSRDNIGPNETDDEFKKVRFESLVLTNVSKHLLQNFPLKNNPQKETFLYNQ